MICGGPKSYALPHSKVHVFMQSFLKILRKLDTPLAWVCSSTLDIRPDKKADCVVRRLRSRYETLPDSTNRLCRF